MPMPRRIVKPVSYAVAAGLLALSLHVPAARAALVATETVAPLAQMQDRAPDARDRDAVKARLVALGVDPAQVQARADALTDEEASQLAKHMDELPAGGDALTILIIIILLLGIFR